MFMLVFRIDVVGAAGIVAVLVAFEIILNIWIYAITKREEKARMDGTSAWLSLDLSFEKHNQVSR